MNVDLATPFLFQNGHTGEPSTAPLKRRQLCRILCPSSTSPFIPLPTSPILASTSAVVASNSRSALITPQSFLLGIDTIHRTYDPQGWKVASSFPVLKDACASWYYEESGLTKGPVTTRMLADIMQRREIDDGTRVFCCAVLNDGDVDNTSSRSGEWKRIRDLPHLKLAMEALTESRSMPISWLVDEEQSERENATNDADEQTNEPSQRQVTDELNAFLSSTDHLAPHMNNANGGDDFDDGEHEEEYESDGGTKYVRDVRSGGNWVHEALMPQREKENQKPSANKEGTSANVAHDVSSSGAIPGASEKRKRTQSTVQDEIKSNRQDKFSAKNARNWIYVTGLSRDTNEDEVAAYFSKKAGILALDPETLKPRVKLYKFERGEGGGGGGAGELKGDASICYARPESVELALQILDESLFRDGATLSVQRAKFEKRDQHGSVAGDESKSNKRGRKMISEKKRRVARYAALQEVGWDEGETCRIAGGLKGLRIIVLKRMFDPSDLLNDTNDEKRRALKESVRLECQEFGCVKKVTVFSMHSEGVIIVKFRQPNAASDAIKAFNGKMVKDSNDGSGKERKIDASYWDGVTDYNVRDVEKEEKETEKRLDEFGDWLENQDVPDEFRLRVDGEEE